MVAQLSYSVVECAVVCMCAYITYIYIRILYTCLCITPHSVLVPYCSFGGASNSSSSSGSSRRRKEGCEVHQ